jgi:hypothetical protein
MKDVSRGSAFCIDSVLFVLIAFFMWVATDKQSSYVEWNIERYFLCWLKTFDLLVKPH